MVMGKRPLPPKISGQSNPPPFEKHRLQPISAYNVSTVRASEKFIYHDFANKKSTTRFPTSYRWSAYVTSNSPEGWLKSEFVEDWVPDICSWCAAKRLQLNTTKIEILWFGSVVNLRKMSPGKGVISIGQSVIKLVKVICDLGVLIDGELSMGKHVTRLGQTCFFHLRRLWPLRRQLGCDITMRLISALALSLLDYCNVYLLVFKRWH